MAQAAKCALTTLSKFGFPPPNIKRQNFRRIGSGSPRRCGQKVTNSPTLAPALIPMVNSFRLGAVRPSDSCLLMVVLQIFKVM